VVQTFCNIASSSQAGCGCFDGYAYGAFTRYLSRKGAEAQRRGVVA